MFNFGWDTAIANATVLHRCRLEKLGYDLTKKGRADQDTADTTGFRVTLVREMLAYAFRV